MSRNGAGSRVRGPNSALTEFLRERGIDANAIRRRYEEGLEQATAETADGVVTISGTASRPQGREVESPSASSSSSSAVAAAAAAAATKRRAKKKKAHYSDDENGQGEDIIAAISRPRPGQIEFCAECNSRFTVTAYSKSARNGSGLLCHSCGSKYAAEEKAQKKTQMSSRKRKKSVAAALLDKKEFAIPKLQDVCIKLIATYIDDVDVLGDIGDLNMERIARILSRNRSLKDNTFKLFLGSTIKNLQFWDCSNLSADSLRMIAAYCPSLESLNLSMCGQLTDDVVDYYIEKLNNLHAVSFNGAFLITFNCWIKFFKRFGKQLTKFHIGNTFRFNHACLEALVEHAADTLQDVSFNRVNSLKPEDVSLLVKLSHLESLQISYMKDTLQNDDDIIDILKRVGPQLVSLNLDDCGDLSDKVLVDGIRPYCSNLQNLSLALGDGFTSDGFQGLFTEWEINHGLINVNFSRCSNVGDEGIQAFIQHSAKTIVILNLNSVYPLTSSTFQLLASSDCEFLSQLDVGFLKTIGDEEIEFLAERCKSLQLIEAYGDNRITELAKIRRGVKLVGRQSDSI
ncbi:hypothetical protein V1514DRAFT_325695 [Lipomyces japonicus]|uniref:uncharacterized protein n=1 Tax=Lipomyces japonicus TaxID=56871 RepID=UPI0034CF5EE7